MLSEVSRRVNKLHKMASDLVTCEEQQQSLPTFIYRFALSTGRLWRTHLVTGEESRHQLPLYKFKSDCSWSELPGGSLLITGGGIPVVREVVRIDTHREFGVSHQPPMLSLRKCHASVYHAQFLYVLAGYSDGRGRLKECERFLCAESRWEALPSLPTAGSYVSGVVVEGSLYALGGWDGQRAFDLIHRMRLDELTWACMELRLPQADNAIPCL
jgi:hypothetical protein